MADPRKTPPKPLPKPTRNLEQEKLVTLKDDSTLPPPTIGTPPWQSTIFGPMLGQPASRLDTFEKGRSGFRTFARLVAVVSIIVGFFLLLNFIFKNR